MQELELDERAPLSSTLILAKPLAILFQTDLKLSLKLQRQAEQL